MRTPPYSWKKRGRIYTPNGRHPKLISHAANPLAMPLSNDVFRVFYSGRDSENRSSVGAFDYDIMSGRVIADHEEPFISAGQPGCFFEDGVSIGNCYSIGSMTYMLFMAWRNPKSSHWYGDIGRFIVNDDLTLSIDQAFPYIAHDDFNSISLSYPWVHARKSGGYEMWYGSTEAWDAGNGEMLHIFKHAVSQDGESWRQTDHTIPFSIGAAQAFSRPTLIENPDGTLDMWFSYRSGNGTSYRIGHSQYSEGVWSQTPGHPGIDVSETGWDSEMIEYPFVFEHDQKVFMLYNGNNYGETGIGLAELMR